MVYIGIDPGKHGGIVAIHRKRVVLSVAMPTTSDGIWWTLQQLISVDGERRVYIEDVHAMPGQGVTSMFTFGYGVGLLHMACVASKLSYVLVQPQTWQRVMRCETGGNKNITKTLAQELFPKIKVTHALADALLIAEYNRRQGR